MDELVKLISKTEPVGDFTAEDLVAYVARVSNPKNQDNHETSAGLLRYLVRHKHWSPLELVDITVEIKTTRDIARQILRHRSFTFQEFSQRYAEVDQLCSFPFHVREARLQDTKNRQNSIPLDPEEDSLLREAWAEYQQEVITQAYNAYNWALENGIAKGLLFSNSIFERPVISVLRLSDKFLLIFCPSHS